jgi:aminomethyltransferase
LELDRLRFFRFTRARINDVELILSRSGYTGELGYELYTPAEDAGALWEHMLQTGRDFGLQPYGVAAMQSLRLEKALVLYGNDVNENYTPFHVGLDRWIKFEKREFIGREALLQVQAQGLQERWTGLVLESPVPAVYGNRVYSVGDVSSFREKMFSGSEAMDYKDTQAAGEEVGYVTFSNRGHTVGKTLAMAYIRTPYTWSGCNLLVDINGRLTAAKVVQTPFFDPQGARMRAKPQDDALQAKPQAVPRAPKAPADAPPRPPEEDAPPPDRSDESPPGSAGSSSKSGSKGGRKGGE